TPSLPAIRPATTTSGWPANPWVRARNRTRAAASAAAPSLESFPPVSESSTGASVPPRGRTASISAPATRSAPEGRSSSAPAAHPPARYPPARRPPARPPRPPPRQAPAAGAAAAQPQCPVTAEGPDAAEGRRVGDRVAEAEE